MVILIVIGVSSWIDSVTSEYCAFLVIIIIHATLSIRVSVSVSSIICIYVMRILKWTCCIFWAGAYLIWLNIHACVAITWVSWSTCLHSCLPTQIDTILFIIIQRRVLRLLLLLASLQRATALLFCIHIIWSFLASTIKITGGHGKLLHIYLWVYSMFSLYLLLWLLRMRRFTFIATLRICCILFFRLIFSLLRWWSLRIYSVWIYLWW